MSSYSYKLHVILIANQKQKSDLNPNFNTGSNVYPQKILSNCEPLTKWIFLLYTCALGISLGNLYTERDYFYHVFFVTLAFLYLEHITYLGFLCKIHMNYSGKLLFSVLSDILELDERWNPSQQILALLLLYKQIQSYSLFKSDMYQYCSEWLIAP